MAEAEAYFLRNLQQARAWTANPLLFLWSNCRLTKADPKAASVASAESGL
jgi:hypothetical protein